MRDAFDGEDCVKAKGEKYLPMKSGTEAITDPLQREKAYKAYKLRAEFPELVAPTVRGSVGIMLKQSASFELPTAMEYLRTNATRDGLTLEALHRRIAVEMTLMGRYGLLPGITKDGSAYLAGYTAETIINWDSTDGDPDFLVVNETGSARDRSTGKWKEVGQYRECGLNADGAYFSRVWTQNAKQEWVPGPEVIATTRKGTGLDFLPFVFFGTNDLNAEPDDVPLYGLGRIAVRIYRMDADYTFAMHMTSEPTPYVTGFSDPTSAKKAGHLPTGLGSSTLWVLPEGGDAGFLEFGGAGVEAQKTAIGDALNRAVAFGAQALTDTSKSAESGDAIQLRLGHQHSLLHLIAQNSAAGLEKALQNIAVWTGEDPEKVKVKPNLEFFDKPLDAQTLTALVAGWQQGAYSYSTMFNRLKRGNIVPMDRTEDDEKGLMAADPPPEQVAALPADMNL
ncbi:DUF4055 domain-containing protein [Nitrobacteraceae bacterium UC4446_H13]